MAFVFVHGGYRLDQEVQGNGQDTADKRGERRVIISMVECKDATAWPLCMHLARWQRAEGCSMRV